MKKLLLFPIAGLCLAAVLMIASFDDAHAQPPYFQHSSVVETFMPGTNNTGNGGHIHDVNCYTYSNLSFSDFQSDLYVATMAERNTLYYKRTRSGMPYAIIDQGVIHFTG